MRTSIESEQVPTRILVEELLREKQKDEFCIQTLNRIEEGRCHIFGEDPKTGLLMRQHGEMKQVVVPKTLRPKVLVIAHHSKVAAHPGGRNMYQALRRDFYWTAMAIECYVTVRSCSDCAKEKVSARARRTDLKLFPAAAPLEDVAMDLLGELMTTPMSNKYILVITDRFTKLV